MACDKPELRGPGVVLIMSSVDGKVSISGASCQGFDKPVIFTAKTSQTSSQRWHRAARPQGTASMVASR